MTTGRQFWRRFWRKPLEKACYVCGKARLDARLLVSIKEIDLCDECVDGAHAIVTTRFREGDWEKLKGFAP